MKPFGALIPFEEAKRVVETNIKPITRVETISIDDASGRVLAGDMVATLNTPPFNRAAMDGYAVKARDTFNSGQFSPRILNLVGELHAGETPRKRVTAGECIQIATGAMMPGGADAVVMVEDTEAENSRVKVFKSAYPGANGGRKGGDEARGGSGDHVEDRRDMRAAVVQDTAGVQDTAAEHDTAAVPDTPDTEDDEAPAPVPVRTPAHTEGG